MIEFGILSHETVVGEDGQRKLKDMLESLERKYIMT